MKRPFLVRPASFRPIDYPKKSDPASVPLIMNFSVSQRPENVNATKRRAGPRVRPAFGGGFGFRPTQERTAVFFRPCGALGCDGLPVPTVETVGYCRSPLWGGWATQEDWGAVQARGAIENSPAIYRWGTWAKDRSQSREGRKRRGPRCTPPPYSDRTRSPYVSWPCRLSLSSKAQLKG